MQCQKLRANLVFRCAVQLSHDANDRGFGRNLPNVFQDPPIPGADLFISRNGQTNHVDVLVRFFHDFIETLPQQGTWTVQPWGINHDDLRIITMHQPADGVTRSFWLVSGDRNLLPNQCISQRGLACIWPADEAHETGAETLRGVGVVAVVCHCLNGVVACASDSRLKWIFW